MREVLQRAENFESEVKLQAKETAKEREKEVLTLTQMAENSHKKVIGDLAKR